MLQTPLAEGRPLLADGAALAALAAPPAAEAAARTRPRERA